MKKLLPRRLTTAGLLPLLYLTLQFAPGLCTTLHARAQTQSTLAESLPESDFLLVIDYKRLSDEAIPRVLADQRELREGLARGLDDVAAITGIDLRAVGRVVIAVRAPVAAAGKGQVGRTTVSLVRGVDQEKWLAFARQKGGGLLKETRHGSKAVYLLRLTAEEKKKVEEVTLSSVGEEGLAFAALDADTLVYGTAESVGAALDARDGKGTKIRPELAATAARSPDAFIVSGGLVPPSLTAELLPGGKEAGNEASKILSNLKQFSVAVELAPAGFDLTAACDAGSAEQAKSLGDLLTAFKTLAAFSQPKARRDRIIVEQFRSAVVSVDGREVRVKSSLPDANAKALLTWGLSDTYVGSAAEHRKKGELEAALADYDKALALDPENVGAYINRGLVHSDRGELDAADADETKALALDPDNATAYNNRGFARSKKGDYEAAIADLEKAIALDPKLAYSYNNRAHALAALGRYEEALADYDRSLALDAKNAVAYNNRGNTLYELGQHARAVADYDKALALDPKLVESYNGRGNARTALGEYDAAVEDHDRALALDPKSPGAYSGRGLARFYKNELDTAIADFDKAIALSHAPPAYYYSNRGFARAGKGDNAGALADFDKAVALNPKLAFGYQGRGVLRYEQGDYAAAIADFDRAIAADPEYAESYGYRGLALLAQRKDAAAARDLKRCLELDESLKDFFEEKVKEVFESRRRPRRRAY
jgi:tetratricopeptide (TPR) repeat protein